MPQSSTMQQRFHAWLSDRADETVLRWIFRSVVTVTIIVLAVDLAGMNGLLGNPESAEITQQQPSFDLPGIVPSVLAPLLPGGDKRLMPLPQPDGAMAKPMTFELVGGGKLMATGTITSGISESFAAEIGKRGDYIKTVVLNSPGGSVTDALAMGRLIRENKFATEVEAGRVVMPAGIRRRPRAPSRRQGHDRRASNSVTQFRQRPAARRDERRAKHLGALPALSRRHGHQPAGLGPRHGNAARQIVRVQAG
jgi:hypothetical protein